MSKKNWTLWRTLAIWARARRIKEARERAILREYNEFWMENNRDFIKKCEKEDEREISRDYALYPYKSNLRAYSGGKVGEKGGFGISRP